MDDSDSRKDEQTRNVSLRAPSSEPSLHPRRDSNEDANETFTRKRPRLESGPRGAVRSMSADRALSTSLHIPERDFQTAAAEAPSTPKQIENPPHSAITPSRITINIKEPQSGGANGHTSSEMDTPPEAESPSLMPQDISKHSTVETEVTQPEATHGLSSPPQSGSSSASSPIEIEEVPNVDDIDQDPVHDIMVDGMDDDFFGTALERFPFAEHGNHFTAANLYLSHVDNHPKVDLSSLDQLANWLIEQCEYFRLRKSQWAKFYYEQRSFWEIIGKIFARLISRHDTCFGSGLRRDELEPVLLSLFQAQLVLVNQLVQVDSYMIMNHESDDVVEMRPLSWRHLNSAKLLFVEIRNQDEKDLLTMVLNDRYGLDVSKMRISVVKTFIEADGIHNLATFARTIIDHFPKEDKRFGLSLGSVVELAGASSKFVYRCLQTWGDSIKQSSRSVARHLKGLFDCVDKQLGSSIDKQQDPLNSDIRKNVVEALASVLLHVVRLDPKLGDQILETLIARKATLLAESHPDVVPIVWKIKLMKRYISKGRMDLRIQGIEIMSSGLIAFFQTHRNDDQQRGSLRVGTISEVLEFVADVLLEEKITDYLVGVESHPQLITRGYNAVGFLAVTNKFNTDQADVVWKSIVTSQDPRVVGATLFLLEQLTKQLTKFDEDVYFCRKLLDSPLPIMSREACSFYTIFLETLRIEYRELSTEYHLKEENFESSLLPLKLCLRLMREFSPTGVQGLAATGIFGDALNTLSHLANLTSPAVRRSLYAMCMQSLQAQSEDTPADIQAMLGMTKDCPDDLKYLASEVRVLPILMDEFCSFVSRSKESTQVLDNGRLFQALQPRLELILKLVMLDPQTVNEERTKVFWNHLVGSEAINFIARDVAWRLLATFVPGSGAENPFLDRCYEDFLSPTELKPDYFTQNFFHFVINITKFKIVKKGQLVIPSDGEVVDIPGIDLLWRAILTAAPNAGEETAMDFLATIYLDASWPKTITPASLEATHAALVDDCLNRLKSAHQDVRSAIDLVGTGEHDEVIGHFLGHKALQAQSTFLRTLNVLSRVLITIRKLPAFRSASAQAAQPAAEVPTVIRGLPVTVRCQFFKAGTGNSAVRDIYIGELDTCLQLHRRIARIASEFDMASYKIIWSGRMFNLLVKPRELLKDVGITTIANFIVREAPGLNDLQAARVTPSKQCRTAFEEHIISNFHEFYALMDSNDASSAAMFEFFSNFPKYEKVKSLVQTESVPLVEVFPPGQMYKIQYSFQCLTEVLQDKTEDGTLRDDFVLQGVHLIESFLTAGEDSYQVPSNDLILASAAINGLFDFLTNFEGGGASTSPFSNPRLLVMRVCMIMWSSLNYHDWMQLVLNSYDFLLTASRVCPSAWQAFSQPEGESEKVKIMLNNLHYRLLLGPKPLPQPVRMAIRNMIKTYVERFTPPAHLSKHDLVNFFWAKVSSLLLQTPTQPLQCAEVFELAEIILENHSADLALSQQALEQHFGEWSTLLERHKHEEIVGQDKVDQIIRGFSSILRLCALALPSDATEPSSQKLVRQLWHNFLFPRKSIAFGELPSTAQPLPVLESGTRQSMLLLIITLINGSSSLLEDFLDLAAEPRLDDRFRRGWSVDRSLILRAPSGFVGMRNLGNTCYMNSLMTQLFMNPGFRAFILRCRTSTAAATARLLLETQNLFAHMQNSYGKAADAGEFTCNIKTLTEDSIDTREQMDVDEFMNTLFMRWEEQMLTNESKEEFRSFYSGKTVQQIKSKECDHVSERDDTCLAIQCDVQGKATLEESLQAYIEGDVMQGDNKYKCEPCGKFVDAVKRTCLKEIPDHLILQLKRFEFDLGFQRRSKINDLFEFPMSVDMSKYTFDYLSDPTKPIAADVFDLVGVIVHRGHADHGHYVSYIRARPTLPGQPPVWLQFDDQDVSTFQPRDIAEACYGGMPTNKDNQYTSYSPGPKLYNAYMLFYQRSSTVDEQTWPQPTNTTNPQHVSLPKALERTVDEENSSILEQYCLFDLPHRDLVLTLLSKLERMSHTDDEAQDHKNHKSIIAVALEYISSVWARTKELPDFEIAMNNIKGICTRCHLCSFLVIAWFSEPSGNELRDLILKSSQAKVRQQIRSLIMTCLEALRHDPQMYGADVNEETPNATGNGASTIITKLAAFAPQDLGYNGRAWEEYWGLLSDIAMLGAQECWIMIEEGILLVCIELFMYHWQTQLQTTYARVADLYRRRPQPPPPNNLIWLIAHLFERIDFNVEPDYMSSQRRLRAFDPKTGLVPLLSEEYEMLMEYNKKEFSLIWLTDLFEKWDSSKEGQNDFAPGEIIRYLMSNHGTLARNVAHTLQSNIEQYETTYSDPYMRATCYVLQYSRNKDIIRDMTAFMAKTSKKANPANDSEGYNGEMCLRYFHSLFRVSANDLNKYIRDPAFFWKQFLQNIDIWAPYLLTFEKTYKIGIETYQLLKESLFKDVALLEMMEEKDVSLEKRRATAVRKLFKGCAMRAQDVLQSETTKAAVFPIISAMKDCQEYLVLLVDQTSEFAKELQDNGDEGLIEQYDGYKQVFDTLPTLGPDDDLSRSGELGNGGTEWEDLDLVDDVEASELTDVEGSDDELAG